MDTFNYMKVFLEKLHKIKISKYGFKTFSEWISDGHYGTFSEKWTYKEIDERLNIIYNAEGVVGDDLDDAIMDEIDQFMRKYNIK